ncbi:SHOCT domain-containing protein [Haloferax sp. DFSO52]|uniref:SHOCT domain-containing protein n=1 Tax=Haloferax sp. DFSO52 TaxID=3388505 RepID=UPI003A8BC5C0
MTESERHDGVLSADGETLSALADRAAGESVTAASLAAVAGAGSASLWDIVDEDERPQYLLEGTMLDIVTGEEPMRKMAGRDGSAYTLFTDRAVRFVVQYPTRVDIRTAPYETIRTVSLQTVGQNNRLRVETPDVTYVSYPSATSVDECTAAVDFAETQVNESQTATDSAGTTGDVLDALERLAALRDRGALSDEEFEAKKHDLLDRL